MAPVTTPDRVPDPPVGSPEWKDLLQAARAELAALTTAAQCADASAPPAPHPQPLTDSEHQQLLRLAASPAGRQYQIDNVIGNAEQTFGFEIEFMGGDIPAIARELFDAGITGHPERLSYHSASRARDNWNLERDGDASELVSKVLTDTPETWAHLAKACEIISRNGGTISVENGGHVHVGVASTHLSGNLAAMKRLPQLCAWMEDIIYRLAAANGPDGATHRGASTRYRWCGPQDLDRLRTALDSEDVSESSIMRTSYSKSDGLNMSRILNSGPNATVEFRYFDSSLDPVVLQAHAWLACLLMRRAVELSDVDVPHQFHPLGDFYLHPDPAAEEQLLRDAAAVLCPRPQDRLNLYSAFGRGHWQPDKIRVGEELATEVRATRHAIRDDLERLLGAFPEVAGRNATAAECRWLGEVMMLQKTELAATPPTEAAATALARWCDDGQAFADSSVAPKLEGFRSAVREALNIYRHPVTPLLERRAGSELAA